MVVSRKRLEGFNNSGPWGTCTVGVGQADSESQAFAFALCIRFGLDAFIEP